MAQATVRKEERPAVELTAEQQEGLLRAGVEPTVREVETAKDGETTITHERPAKVWMYSPEGIRKALPGQDVTQAWNAGYRFQCPRCGGTCEGILVNCPSVEQPAVMRCPIATCRKIMHDYRFTDDDPKASPDKLPGEIDFAAETTPERRLRNRLRRHMEARHPSELPMYFEEPATRARGG